MTTTVQPTLAFRVTALAAKRDTANLLALVQDQGVLAMEAPTKARAMPYLMNVSLGAWAIGSIYNTLDEEDPTPSWEHLEAALRIYHNVVESVDQMA